MEQVLLPLLLVQLLPLLLLLPLLPLLPLLLLLLSLSLPLLSSSEIAVCCAMIIFGAFFKCSRSSSLC